MIQLSNEGLKLVLALVTTAVEASPKTGRKPKRPRTISCDASVPSIQAALDAVDASVASAATDLNPLAPCGACNEWLLKIAEANPSFKIVTFDSIDCDSVYIHQLL
ncbi:hypothetical protein DYB34_012585 [Aphanomyces astaci]|uniref:CMP/dCMP-type deaminase domain-containing protein n=1 Tax=Aphanomyces astaci TaxID=112090 RepID=A0A418BGR9_APHAT|nr:hypothetical protein DYB34_012585 [Aphanomyces astaci]